MSDTEGLLSFVREMSREEKILYLARACNTIPQIFEHFEDERLTVTIISYIQRKNNRERVLSRVDEYQKARSINDTRQKISGAYQMVLNGSAEGNRNFMENLRARTELASRKMGRYNKKAG